MGACAQLAQALGLHRDHHDSKVDPIVREERINVFWVCYIMDKTISMAIGRSSSLHDFDCDVPLPSGNGETFGTRSFINSSIWRHELFLLDIRLAEITSRVYRKLYSAQSVARHTIDSLADAVGDLDEQLLAWRDNIPAEYRPELDVGWRADPLHRHILQLHLGYYNCLYNIHRAVFALPFGQGSASYMTPDRPLHLLRRNRIYGSAALAMGAARAGLRLILALTENFDNLIDMRIWSVTISISLLVTDFTRLVVYYLFSAVIALFIRVLWNPRQPSTKTDLQLITASMRLFDRIYVRSDLSEKMNALTSRILAEATRIVERPDRGNEGRGSVGFDSSQPQIVQESNSSNAKMGQGLECDSETLKAYGP